MKIFISAGHFGSDVGAENKNLKLKEHNEAVMIWQEMRVRGYQVIPLAPLSEKIKYINALSKPGDSCIEIHFNSDGGDGIEVIYHHASIEGKKMAQKFQQALLEYLPFRDRGIKSNNELNRTIGFLSKTKIPAIIVECLFIDNDNEAKYLLYPRAHIIIANALGKAIIQ